MQFKSVFFASVLFSVTAPVAAMMADATPAPAPVVAATDDVEASMKDMGFLTKQALNAPDAATLVSKLTELQQVVASLQAYQFSQEKQQVFQEGLTKVQTQVSQALAQAQQGDEAGAKTTLQSLNQLKKDYHKQRSPSVWELLFGRSDDE